MKFIIGTVYSIFITFILIIAVTWWKKDFFTAIDTAGMTVTYLVPMGIGGCLIGELLQFVFKKLVLNSILISFICFTALGFIWGLIVNDFIFNDKSDITFVLTATLGSVSFYIGRNFSENLINVLNRER